jgi:hypothetical protein
MVGPVRMRRLFAVPLALLAILLAAGPAWADTWTVTDGSSDASTPPCNTTAHTCVSLRTAIAASEATKNVADVIDVPAGAIFIGSDLVIQSDITVNGAGARTSVIDGGGKSRGFRVTAAGVARINRYTIRNGAGGGGSLAQGGGIVNQGTATLDHVRVTNSSSGGVANLTGGLLVIAHSLIDANVGGGVLNVGGAEVTPLTWTQMADSTIAGNTGAISTAGGIVSTNRGFLTMLRSTVADNTGGTRSPVGGLAVETTANAQIIASIVARNHTSAGVPANCGATRPTDSGANVEDDATCGFTFTGDPGLASQLANAGGETDVFALAATSPAVDRVPAGDNCPAGAVDQRGQARPVGAACDAGAYEFVPPVVEPTPTPQPTVSPTPTATPTPTPTATPKLNPVAGKSVAAVPVAGTVLVKLPGERTFKKLDPSVIANGSEVDTREGTVEITRSDGGKAIFYGGIFKLSQSGGITTLTLTEKLTGCPSGKRAAASAAAAKPKTRKLWGDGKGRFRTKGQYSAATVRGTKWLVQDGCRYTRTTVATGVVSVRDAVLKKTKTLRKGKSYTARPRR